MLTLIALTIGGFAVAEVIFWVVACHVFKRGAPTADEMCQALKQDFANNPLLAILQGLLVIVLAWPPILWDICERLRSPTP